MTSADRGGSFFDFEALALMAERGGAWVAAALLWEHAYRLADTPARRARTADFLLTARALATGASTTTRQ
jgi:hypothetical protein